MNNHKVCRLFLEILSFTTIILDNIVSSIPDEHWFVPAVTENELQESIESEKLTTVIQEMTDAENTRDMTIKELENFLGEFRSGKLRTCKLICILDIKIIGFFFSDG